MTGNEHKKLTSKMKCIDKEVAKSKVKAKDLLLRTGLYEKDGSLKKAYR